MALYKTYQGSFVSRRGHTVRCEIWREASKAPATVGELDFPYESPLTIEWDADSKRETIQGSTATLTVISPGDRTYIDLYTTVAGSVQLRVYRDGSLFWRGTLDTEHYEEPFSAAKDYDVTFTFTDFGILDRLKYDLTGSRSIDAIIRNALSRAQLYQPNIYYEVSTTSDGEHAHLWCVRSDNFTDEDGETLSLREVLEGVLVPLDLHMRQQGAWIYVYDMHSLMAMPSSDIEWAYTDQVLGVDSVANAVTVTLSPYAESAILKGETIMTYPGQTSVHDFSSPTQHPILTEEGWALSDGTLVRAWFDDYSSHTDSHGNVDYQYLSFGMYLKRGYGGNLIAKTIPIYGSEEHEFIMMSYKVSGHTSISQTATDKGPYSASAELYLSAPVVTFTGGVVSPDSEYATRLRVKMELLYDVRYNFSTAASSDNTESNWNYMSDRTNVTYMPVAIVLKDADGNVTHHYRNLDRCRGNRYDTYFSSDRYASNGCGWVEGNVPATNSAAEWPCWLAFYSNADSRATKNPATDGFAVNRHAFGYMATGKMPESYKARNEGELLLPPPVTGTIEVQIYRGLLVYDYNKTQVWGEAGTLSRKWLGDNIRWWGFTAPMVEIIDNGPKMEPITSEDIEFGGILDANAKEDISIDTICGSDIGVPGARGVYALPGGRLVSTATRGNRTTSVEQLLIGTMHSHYATRHTVLRGTAELVSGSGMRTYKDPAIGADIKFALVGSVCDLRADENEVVLIETNADDYTSVGG